MTTPWVDSKAGSPFMFAEFSRRERLWFWRCTQKDRFRSFKSRARRRVQRLWHENRFAVRRQQRFESKVQSMVRGNDIFRNEVWRLVTEEPVEPKDHFKKKGLPEHAVPGRDILASEVWGL